MSICHKTSELDKTAIEIIKQEYLSDNIPWFLGYSGGKDSSALLKIVFNALLQIEKFHKPITVVYCDTGVENPIVTSYVYDVFKKFKKECDSLQLPFIFKIVIPELNDRYFVKVIGRGYPCKFRFILTPHSGTS